MSSATYGELLKRNRNFRLLWTGQVISELGTWFSFIAELGVMRLISGSASGTTALLVARLLPFLLAAPFAGVVADRLSRKRILIVTDLLRAVVALLFLLAIPLNSIWIVVAGSALNALLTMFFDAAKNAAIPNVVNSHELLTANVLSFSTRFLQFTLGAALGGLTAAQFGYSAAFVFNSISYVASAAFVLPIAATAMRQPVVDDGGEVIEAGEKKPHTTAGFFDDIRGGLAYVWSTPFVRAIILVNFAWATGGGMATLIFDQIGGHSFAHSAADRGDWNVAVLFTAGGCGIFLGMMLARRAGAWASEPRRAGLFIGWSLLVQGVIMAAGGLMPTLWSMAVMIGVSRVVLGMEFGVQETLMMRALPDEYRGRVFTTDRSIELATMAAATIVAGWLTRFMGPEKILMISGLLSASPGLFWLLALSFTRFTVPARAVGPSYAD